jgi:hypothetical protein
MSTTWYKPLTDSPEDRLATERVLAFDVPWQEIISSELTTELTCVQFMCLICSFFYLPQVS